MKPKEVCVLADGRRVQFLLQRRAGRDPYYNVRFVGNEGQRVERSTKCASLKRARDAAVLLIEEEYSPKVSIDSVRWDDAIEKIKAAMRAHNLRDRSVQDYEETVGVLREMFPASQGPADFTEPLAKQFKLRRQQEGKSAYTVANDLNTLSVVWHKWLMRECGLVSTNPWEFVEKPKVDEIQPRYIEEREKQAFFDWLTERWGRWRLPVLFFEVKSLVGRRLLQLCSLPATALQDGRLVFESQTNKGRRMEYARVPEAIYRELQALGGPSFLWERFSEQLAAIYRSRKLRGYVKEFTPVRLKRWLQNEVSEFCKAHEGQPGFRSFTAHNFRDTAMTKAWDQDIPIDKAAIALGCHPETMKKHYIRKDRVAIADQVLGQIQEARPHEAGDQGKAGEGCGEEGSG